jgi:hypothetical protein
MEATIATVILAIGLILVVKHYVNKGKQEAGKHFVAFFDEHGREHDFSPVTLDREKDIMTMSKALPFSQVRIVHNSCTVFSKPFRARNISKRLAFYHFLIANYQEEYVNGKRCWVQGNEPFTADELFSKYSHA